MIAAARQSNPGLPFAVTSMLKLPFPDDTLAGVVAMYSIIHFGPEDRPQALGARTLCADGRLLVSSVLTAPGSRRVTSTS